MLRQAADEAEEEEALSRKYDFLTKMTPSIVHFTKSLASFLQKSILSCKGLMKWF